MHTIRLHLSHPWGCALGQPESGLSTGMQREHLPPQRRKKQRLITPAIFLIFKLVAAYRGRLLLYVYVIAVNDADSAVVLCVVELAGWRHRHCCT